MSNLERAEVYMQTRYNVRLKMLTVKEWQQLFVQIMVKRVTNLNDAEKAGANTYLTLSPAFKLFHYYKLSSFTSNLESSSTPKLTDCTMTKLNHDVSI